MSNGTSVVEYAFYTKVRKEKKDLYKEKNKTMTLFSYYSILILVVSSLLFAINLLLLLPSERTAIAQIAFEGLEPPANTTEFSPSAANVTQLDVKGTQIPMVEKLSDKGSYIVQLRWNPNPAILLPQEGFDLTIYFMNPNIAQEVIEEEGIEPEGEEVEQEGDVEQEEIGEPGSSMILSLMPVETYDISIYSDDGSVLWKKVDQTVTGGRAFERVVFANEYNGPITIEINNITGVQSGTDSVSFNARIIKS